MTLAEELEHVERYLRLEQARFRDSLHVTVDMAPETLGAVVPAMSVQPLVENAVRHGVERRAGTGRVAIERPCRGRATSSCASPTTAAGSTPTRLPRLLAGAGGGIGLSNVDARLRATFGERYALRIESELGAGHDGGHDRSQPDRRGRRARAAAGGGGSREPMSGDQLTILAVDDERTQLEDLARLLRSSPSVKEVECAYDGHDALVKASTQAYDAIFLDVRMPDLDGLELGRVLRRFAAPPQLVFV